jgi:hypothetical protein
MQFQNTDDTYFPSVMPFRTEMMLTSPTPCYSEQSWCLLSLLNVIPLSCRTELMLAFPAPCHSFVWQNRADACFPCSMSFLCQAEQSWCLLSQLHGHSIILQNRAGAELLYLEWVWLPLLTGSAFRRLLQLKRKVTRNQNKFGRALSWWATSLLSGRPSFLVVLVILGHLIYFTKHAYVLLAWYWITA